MALYALSDLHLALSVDKPMDVFGSSWHNYMDKILSGWFGTIGENDMVVVGGDVSWAMYLDELTEDFEFLNALPGRKLLLKGNHDYWWESISKMRNYVQTEGFESINFLHNDALLYDGVSIAGTRGWILPGADGFNSEDRKIYERELGRLRLSLEAAVKLEEKSGEEVLMRIVAFHYPPIDLATSEPDENIMKLLKEFGVRKCIYGHIHGPKLQNVFCGDVEGINFECVSADYLHFKPIEIYRP